MEFDIGKLYQDVRAKLYAAELRAAELRGQVQILEELMSAAQQPVMTGDPLDAPEESPAPEEPPA